MAKEKFSPEDGVSYSAGVACIWLDNGEPKLLLVLQRAGEKNTQKSGGIFVEEKVWKMPMGHFDPEKDEDLAMTAHREFEEESGLTFDKKLIDPELSVALRIPSERPGAQFHEDRFFLVVSNEEPRLIDTIIRDEAIEGTKLFSLKKLPDGKTPGSEGAALSWGHRKKLKKLLLACGESRKGKEIVENLLKNLAEK
jgi:8-oxo-dGTP pyrophosphatase MutT (NUDIX family)